MSQLACRFLARPVFVSDNGIRGYPSRPPTKVGTPNALFALLLFASTAFAAPGEFPLATFGPVKTAAEAEATLQVAITNVIAQGGGFIVIGPDVARDWVARNLAPASTRRETNTVTILDRRGGVERVLLPSNGHVAGSTWTARHLARAVRQPIDMTLGLHPTTAIETGIAGGTLSYAQPCLDAVPAGKDARIYLPTIRGLAAGSHVNFSGQPRAFGATDRGPLKALGWDKDRGAPFIVMDLQHDHPAGALISNKHVVNSLTMTDHSQSDNQSMGLMVARHNYAQGDSFVIHARSETMGNVMSAAGDEGGLTFASDISNDLRPFRSTVESVDWSKQELVYAPGACRNHTLGTSRPLINFNTNKWITAGTAYFVGAGHADPWHPDVILANVGGVFGKDTGWTQDIVGRFFAFDEPTEYLDPANDPDAGYTVALDIRVHRWYLISKLENHADGVQRIHLDRTRWWIHHQSPSLYNTDNWSYAPHAGQDRLKPLRYIIAPGAVVADVSRAWTDSEAGDGRVSPNDPRTLKLAPSPDAGTAFDFEKGDPIAQAIGPDPWNVTGLRVRQFNCLPSTLPDAALHCVNWGRVAVDSALGIAGGGGSLETDAAQMKASRAVRFGKGVDFFVTTATGIRFGADVASAALQFEQPHALAQPLVWHANGRPAASLTVDPQTGDFALRARATRVASLKLADGLSAGAKPARNLRGFGIRVKRRATAMTITFPHPEADPTYALCVQPSWPTASAVITKTAESFTVRFDKPAPRRAALDWVLVR